MQRVISGSLSTVFVWFALIGNVVIRCNNLDVGFEPRDSMSDHEKKRLIEDWDMNLDKSTEPAVEIAPTRAPEWASLCEACPECEICVKLPLGKPKLPNLLTREPRRFIIFFSVQGTKEMPEALRKMYSEGGMDRAIWRAGLKPLRIWHRDCTFVTSMFSGAHPACNCNPAPQDYQLVLGGFEDLLAKDNVKIDCGAAVCTINVEASTDKVWYVYDTWTNPLLQKSMKIGNPGLNGVHYVSLPALSLQIYSQFVSHEITLEMEQLGISRLESFYAFNRTQIRELALDLIKPLQSATLTYFLDVERLVELKLSGKSEYCIKVGNKAQNTYTFDKFLDMDKGFR